MIKEYAGVGSRDVPDDVSKLMSQLATALEKVGYVLRSGGAKGADSAFERGVCDKVHTKIYLPYPRFNGNTSPLHWDPTEAALAWAGKAHPYFARITSDFTRKAHARNAHQVLGDDCATPCHFVLCWTPDGAESEQECHSVDVTGGTRTAIVIASMNNIPVFNLARPDAVDRLRAFVKSLTMPARLEWQQDQAYIQHVLQKKRASRNKTTTTRITTPAPG